MQARLAPLEDLGVVDIHHIAGGAADHLQTVPSGAGECQTPPENTAGAQIFHHGGHAVLVDADQRRLSPLQHAHGAAGRIREVVDHIVRAKAFLGGLETLQHPLVLLIADVLEQRALFQFLAGQHGPLSLPVAIITFMIPAPWKNVKEILRQIS